MVKIAQTLRGTRRSPTDSAFSWVVAFSYLGAATILLQTFNGLETACTLFFYTVAWRHWQELEQPTAKGLTVLGVILGFLVLSRIDAVFLVITLSLYELTKNHEPFPGRVLRFIAVGGTAFVVSSPWWFFNVVRFHSIMPTSGKAEQTWALKIERLILALGALNRVLVPWVNLDRLPGVLLRSAVLLLVMIWAVKAVRVFRYASCNSKAMRTVQFGALLAVSTIGLVFWYTLSSWASHFYVRYFLPLALISVIVGGLAAASLFSRRPCLVACACAGLATCVVLQLYKYDTGRRPGGYEFYTQQLALVRAYVPNDEAVAAGQSGTLGFFRKRVVNLDGKVNPVALRYRGRMWTYLDQIHVSWLCDFPCYAEMYLGPNPQLRGWMLVASTDQFALYKRAKVNDSFEAPR
jgi:hypothetical protein